MGPGLDRSVERILTADETPQAVARDRRSGFDRRRLTLWTFMQSGLTPRRRVGRRHGEHDAVRDWHEPHLLFLAIMILLLSVTDAFLTLALLTEGAREANPFLDFILRDYPKLFAVIKMGFTGGGVLVLVAMARARIFRVLRVETLMHGLLAGYVALIVYEWWLLRSIL